MFSREITCLVLSALSAIGTSAAGGTVEGRRSLSGCLRAGLELQDIEAGEPLAGTFALHNECRIDVVVLVAPIQTIVRTPADAYEIVVSMPNDAPVLYLTHQDWKGSFSAHTDNGFELSVKPTMRVVVSGEGVRIRLSGPVDRRNAIFAETNERPGRFVPGVYRARLSTFAWPAGKDDAGKEQLDAAQIDLTQTVMEYQKQDRESWSPDRAARAEIDAIARFVVQPKGSAKAQ